VRIAFINAVRELGGGERWLLRCGQALKEAGHATTVFCRPTAVWQDQATEAGLEVAPVPMAHDLSALSIARLAAALRQARPEVAICCNQRSARLGVPASRLGGRPAVVFRIGLATSFKNCRFNRWIAGRIDHFVVNARSLAAELTGFGWIPSHRVSVIYNGVETSLHDDTSPGPADGDREPGAPGISRARGFGRRQLWAPRGEKVILSAGRLIEDKGHGDLLTAVASLKGRLPAWRLVVLGEGSRRARLQEQARAAGLADSVLLPGFEPDMPAALAAADVYCQPSRREGLPNVVLEAMAAGLPVVATAVDGTPEVVIDEQTGLLAPPGDPTAMANCLGRLLASDDLRRDLGRRAREHVRQHFSLEICHGKWSALLDGLARAGRGRRENEREMAKSEASRLADAVYGE
jgi:glycosyltransferase involved in cell wall biosynthesis